MTTRYGIFLHYHMSNHRHRDGDSYDDIHAAIAYARQKAEALCTASVHKIQIFRQESRDATSEDPSVYRIIFAYAGGKTPTGATIEVQVLPQHGRKALGIPETYAGIVLD